MQMEIDNEKREQRLAVMKKIEELEKEGKFDVDADFDENPEAPKLLPNKVDYLREKRMNRIKTRVVTAMAEAFFDKMVEEKQIIIKEVTGLENLESVTETGGIITSNHFNAYECFSVIKTFYNSKLNKEHKIYEVIREGNFTNFPGFYGMAFRHCNTLPLSSNHQTMKKFYSAVEEILNRGDFILIYPEQSLWLNYQKPKPLKDGAYRFATKHNVPIIPFFITTKESENVDDTGFPILEYYIHIEKPIYKDQNLSDKDNINMLREKNYIIWKNIYEEFYGRKLEYTCDKECLPDYVIKALNN
jgi:1-acyl-sn-glycerol-3-phosphate acyltransferase